MYIGFTFQDIFVIKKEYFKALNRLNDNQQEAVEYIDGPIMVVAGPGTGKTQILALRIARILEQTDSNPENILCLTFTDAGTKAMRERLIKFIGTDAYHVTIHTFHSFTNEIIQTFSEKFAFSRELKQLDDLNRIKIVHKILDDYAERKQESLITPFHDKYAKKFQIISAIQNLKKEGLNPEEFIKKIDELKAEHENNVKMRGGKPTKEWEKDLVKIESLYDLADVYNEYQTKLRTEGFYDYDDMILMVVERMKSDDELLAYLQERYLYILVDEYQDTNGSQNEIIKLLGSFDPSPNIFVVGDDDQAIYRFQGANLGNILFFSNHFKNVKIVPAIVNYRSTQTVLNVADSLIEKNETRLTKHVDKLDKKLKAYKKDGATQLQVWEFNNATDENITIAKQIQNLKKAGVKYQDIAVIYRNNSHRDDIAEILQKFEIPTKSDFSKDIFENEILKQLVNLLKVIHIYPKDIDQLLYEVMLYDFINIKTVDVYKVSVEANKKKSSFLELINTAREQTEQMTLAGTESSSKSSISNAVKQFVDKVFYWHDLSFNVSLPRLVEHVLTESGMLEYITKSNKLTDGALDPSFENLLAINSFFDYINTLFRADPDLKLAKFLSDLELIRENNIKVSIPNSSQNNDAVNMITAHSSKGLEFDYVFIIKTTSKNWGGKKRNTSLLPKEIFTNVDLEIEEKKLSLEDERRLFYVALTRAKELVYITYAQEYVDYNGRASAATPSQFITELEEEFLEKKSAVPNEKGQVDFEIEKEDFVTKLKKKSKKSYSQEEKEFLLERINNFRLSPSSLNVYLNSPEEFKLKYLIKLPEIKQKEMAMGTAVHSALERFNKAQIAGDAIGINDLLKTYEFSLQDEFLGHEEFDKSLIEGKKWIENYYDSVLRKSNVNVAEAEYKFFFRNVFLEVEDGEAIPLSGTIDKVEWINENAGTVRVVDYKTSKPKSYREIKGLTQSSRGDIWRQLVFYKLLGDLDRDFRPRNNFAKPKYIIEEAAIDFVRPNSSNKFKKETFEITNKDVDELKSLISEVMKKIRNLEFPEEPNIDPILFVKNDSE